MSSLSRKISLLAIMSSFVTLAAEQKEEKEFKVQGEIPEGWEVVESSDGPVIEKWVELKSGEKKKLLLRSFVLRPIVTDKELKFSAADAFRISSGQKIDDILASQNENLSQTENELAVMLQRLHELLASLPNSNPPLKES